MFRDRELENLILFPEVLPMACGWRVVKRAEWVDATDQRPHGLSYALILQDSAGIRILGFDNSHAYDGAGPDDPYDHEHRANRWGQAFRYDIQGASTLISDFMDRLETYSSNVGITPRFLDIPL